MIRLATFSALVVFTASAQAAPETYVVDGNHTFPLFTYSHFGYSNQTHKFNKTSGKVVLDRAAKTGSAEIVIDATSINTGIPMFNEHLQDADFFDTAKYPTITFQGSKMKFKGGVPVSLSGDLTINAASDDEGGSLWRQCKHPGQTL
jgi:polyisoprenoid-binding protein YceI